MMSIIINTRNRKQILFELLSSAYRCHLNFPHEIIVVDDFSEENYSKELKEKFPNIKLIRTFQRSFLIKSRNFGWKKSKGEIIFFIDDDNEIKDRDFFKKAMKVIEERDDIGVLGCRTYYFDSPDYIMVGPNKFNKMTGRTTFFGMNQKDAGQLDGLIETHNCPNAFFTKKEILEKVHGFTEDIVQTLSEADFDEKVRRLGLKVYEYSKLKVYHKSPWQEYKKLSPRHVGGSPERAYFLMRNRFIFIKRYGNIFQKILFTLIFSHVLNLYYTIQLLMLKEFTMIKQTLMGAKDGYIYMIFCKLNNCYSEKK
jgi:GT2 family glycosyltransferase